MRVPNSLTPEADMMLRRYILELADQVIASKTYEGPIFDLASFLAAYVYQSWPAEIRESMPAEKADQP